MIVTIIGSCIIRIVVNNFCKTLMQGKQLCFSHRAQCTETSSVVLSPALRNESNLYSVIVVNLEELFVNIYWTVYCKSDILYVWLFYNLLLCSVVVCSWQNSVTYCTVFSEFSRKLHWSRRQQRHSMNVLWCPKTVWRQSLFYLQIESFKKHHHVWIFNDRGRAQHT